MGSELQEVLEADRLLRGLSPLLSPPPPKLIINYTV